MIDLMHTASRRQSYDLTGSDVEKVQPPSHASTRTTRSAVPITITIGSSDEDNEWSTRKGSFPEVISLISDPEDENIRAPLRAQASKRPLSRPENYAEPSRSSYSRHIPRSDRTQPRRVSPNPSGLKGTSTRSGSPQEINSRSNPRERQARNRVLIDGDLFKSTEDMEEGSVPIENSTLISQPKSASRKQGDTNQTVFAKSSPFDKTKNTSFPNISSAGRATENRSRIKPSSLMRSDAISGPQSQENKVFTMSMRNGKRAGSSQLEATIPSHDADADRAMEEFSFVGGNQSRHRSSQPDMKAATQRQVLTQIIDQSPSQDSDSSGSKFWMANTCSSLLIITS
jgi:hypothetical protein